MLEVVTFLSYARTMASLHQDSRSIFGNILDLLVAMVVF